MTKVFCLTPFRINKALKQYILLANECARLTPFRINKALKRWSRSER